MPDEEKPSSSGGELDPKVAALLAYLLTLVGGIVFYAISKDPFVRFHAMQSILLTVAFAILWVVLFIIGIATGGILFFLNWILSSLLPL